MDTATISDERMKTNQFLGSNMQVANLVVHATAKFGMEFVEFSTKPTLSGEKVYRAKQHNLRVAWAYRELHR